jgi:hypothetical protein
MRTTLFLLMLTMVTTLSLQAQKLKADLGVFGLINRNVNVSLEYGLSDKFSVKGGLGYMLPGRLPWLDFSKDLLDDSETEGYLGIALDNLRISAISLSPEIRFFPGGQALKGLYLGAYGRMSNYMFSSSYTSDVDYTDGGQNFTKENVVFDLSGHLTKIGGGLSIGYQFFLWETISVDMNFFGAGLVYAYASSTVDSPEFPSSRGIGEFTAEELSIIPDILGVVDVEQLSNTSARGTWGRILPVYRANLSIGIAF